MKTFSTDVLIVGAGAAGIRAALAACNSGVEVAMVAKRKIAGSGSTFSKISQGWGIQALVGGERTERNLEAFYEDIIRVGLGRCDQKLVRILVEESGPRLEDLISYGIEFRKESNGDFIRCKGCFSECERAFVTADMENVKKSLLSILRQSPVKVVTGYVADLAMVDEECWGAWVITDDGEMIMISAKATILATGGGAGIFLDHLVTDDEIGDGYALAHRVGAKLTNLEFIQFMLGLKKGRSRAFFPLQDLAKPGVIRDSEGRDFFDVYFPESQTRLKAVHERRQHFPFSCRDSSYLLDVAVAKERQHRRAVYYEGGSSTKKQPQVVHVSHAFNGGVKIDVDGKSTVPGLFAAGEVAGGPHGADRIGGCMMTATQVFGARAGRSAAERAKSIVHIPKAIGVSEDYWALTNRKHTQKGDQEAIETKEEIQRLFTRSLSIIRNEPDLRKCIDSAESLYSRLFSYPRGSGSWSLLKHLEIRNILIVGKLIALSALESTGSLGSHFREDSLTEIRDPASGCGYEL